MSYYVIPDIHGRYDLLTMALEKIYEMEKSGCKIIFLGDYIDRGPDNAAVLNTVMNPPKNYEFVTLMGNHEEMYIEASMNDHIKRFYDPVAAKEIDENIPDFKKMFDWMKELKLFHFEGNNIFAHAWYDVNVTKEQQDRATLLWQRVPDPESFHPDYYLTHGHTPRSYGPTKAPNRCNLDCCAVFTGRMVIARFEEDKLGPQTFYEIFGEDWKES